MTVFTPELAAQAGCALDGPLTGLRMSSDRIDAPRCEGATVTVEGWGSRSHTVMVLDINKLLPLDWPRLDCLIALSTFDGHVVTYDLRGRRCVVDDAVPANARSVRARFERSMTFKTSASGSARRSRATATPRDAHQRGHHHAALLPIV